VVKDAAQDSFVEKLIANVIKNLEVTVTNIHVRFEDSTTNPKKPFSVGVTLRELSLRVCLVIAVYWSFPYFFLIVILQVCVNMTLPTFPAVHHAVVSLLLRTSACYCLIPPTHWALSSKPAACRFC